MGHNPRTDHLGNLNHHHLAVIFCSLCCGQTWSNPRALSATSLAACGTMSPSVKLGDNKASGLLRVDVSLTKIPSMDDIYDTARVGVFFSRF